MSNPKAIPPEEHKFKPGESGNPDGRPKGARSLSTILREMLEEEIEIKDSNGKKQKKKFSDVIVRKLIKKANDGEIKAIQEVFDRTEGKAKQSVDVNNLNPQIVIYTDQKTQSEIDKLK